MHLAAMDDEALKRIGIVTPRAQASLIQELQRLELRL
jgi:hypothetical protein